MNGPLSRSSVLPLNCQQTRKNWLLGRRVKHGISSAAFYKWKAKYGGLEVSDAKRLKALEDENAKLKKLLAEAELDKAMLKEIAAKKW